MNYLMGLYLQRLYHDKFPIFIIKENETWEYEPFMASFGRYAYLGVDNEIFESNNLEDVERIMFVGPQ